MVLCVHVVVGMVCTRSHEVNKNMEIPKKDSERETDQKTAFLGSAYRGPDVEVEVDVELDSLVDVLVDVLLDGDSCHRPRQKKTRRAADCKKAEEADRAIESERERG